MSSSGSPEIEIQFNEIDVSGAERLVASIWRVLEKHSITTPLMDVRSASALIDITLRFRSAEDRALVGKELRAIV
jgi:hypothetical protein